MSAQPDIHGHHELRAGTPSIRRRAHALEVQRGQHGVVLCLVNVRHAARGLELKVLLRCRLDRANTLRVLGVAQPRDQGLVLGVVRLPPQL